MVEYSLPVSTLFVALSVGLCRLKSDADIGPEKAKVVDVLNEVMPQIEQFVGAQLSKVPETPPAPVSAPVLAPEPEVAAPTDAIETDSIPPSLANESVH